MLHPGGIYLSQHLGPDRDAGLDIVDLRPERLRAEFHDVGAVVRLLRTVSWLVPDFTVEWYRDRLLALHEHLEAEGTFVDESGRLFVGTDIGLGIVHTLDMEAASDAVEHGMWRPEEVHFEALVERFGVLLRPAPAGASTPA